jgi:uncharacterized membrane protein
MRTEVKTGLRTITIARRVRLTLTTVRLPGYLPVFGTGGLLGLYLGEFLRFNLDFIGPRSLSPAQILALVALVGPGLMALIWLCSGLVVTSLTGLSLQQALVLDAPSYWPGLLIGVSLLTSLTTGRPATAYHASVVVLVSVLVSLVLGLKVWLVEPLVVKTWRTRLTSPWPVALAILGYVLIVSLLVGLHYRGYNIWGVDLGHWDQGLWNTWHGRLLRFTQYGGLDDSLLADHVVLIAFLIAPLYLIWSDPRALLLLQVLVLAWGAWVAYKLSLRYLASRFAGLCVTLAYLIHPTIVGNGLDASGSFRPDVLTIPLFLSTLLALEERRWKRVVLLTILAMACKERIAFVVIVLGLYIIYRYRQPRLGLALSGLGVLWLIGALSVFLPWVRGAQGSIHYQLNFGHLGGEGGLIGILSTLVTQPRLLTDLALSSRDLLALFFSLLSLALLPFGDLPLMAVGAPILGLFMLAGVPDLFDFHLAPTFPLFFVATIAGIERLTGWGYRRLGLLPARLAVSLSAVLLGASLSATFFWSNGPLSWGFWTPKRPYTFWKNRFVVDEHDRRADRFVAMVPAGEPVIASDFLLSHLTQREWVYHFFDPPPSGALDQVDYAVIDLFETHVQPRETSLRALVDAPAEPPSGTVSWARIPRKDLYRQLLSGGDFSLTAYEDGLLFLRRGPAGANSFHYAVSQVDKADPAVRVDYDFADRLRLIGYDFDGHSGSLTKGRCYRITYYWQVLEGFDDSFTFQYGVNPMDDVQHLSTDFVLIDTFTRAGSEPFRVVHLPTYLLLPPSEWQPGEILREEYEFVLPQDLTGGTYVWQVGLHIVPDYFPIQTSPERWVPETTPFLMSEVEVGGTP